VARHASTHACGVVITEQPLVNYTPLQFGTTGERSVITQFEMKTVEKLGLLKMDFLGLRNLTIIEETLANIKNRHNIDLDIHALPLNDKNTFKLLQQGNAVGIFQLESDGMRGWLKELKPSKTRANFEKYLRHHGVSRATTIGGAGASRFYPFRS